MTLTQYLYILLPLCFFCSCNQQQQSIEKWIEVKIIEEANSNYKYIISPIDGISISIADSKTLSINGNNLSPIIAGDFIITSIDNIDSPEDSLLYKINLDNKTHFKVFKSVVDENRYIINWVLFDTDNKKCWQVSTINYNSDTHQSLDSYPDKLLYPLIEVDGTTWIAPDYAKDAIRITNSWVLLAEQETYWSTETIGLGTDNWKWKLKGWKDMLHAHRDIVNNTYFYTFKFSNKDSINYPFSTLKFIEVPTDYYTGSPTPSSNKLQFGNIKLLPAVYTKDIMDVHEQYLRVGDTLANEVNTIKGYIKYKYPQIKTEDPIYNLKKNVKRNGGSLMPHHFLIYEIDPDYKMIKYDATNDDTQEIETVIETVEIKRYLLFIFQCNPNGKTYLVHEIIIESEITDFTVKGDEYDIYCKTPIFFHSDPENEEEKNSIKDYQENRGKTYGLISISQTNYSGNKIEAIFDVALDWDYIRHSYSSASGKNAYTWILYKLKENDNSISFDNKIIDIKDYSTLDFRFID